MPYNSIDNSSITPTETPSASGGSPSTGHYVPIGSGSPQHPIDTTPAIVKNSPSPYKLSGATTLSQAPEKVWPGGFIGAAAKAAYDTAKGAIEGAASHIDDFLGTLTAQSKLEDLNAIKDVKGNVDYSKPTGLTIGMTPDQRKSFYEDVQNQGTPASKIAKGGSAALGVANIAFLPVTAQIEAAKHIPILKYPAQAASFIFNKLGEAGSYGLGKVVDISPIDQKTKDTLKPFAQDLGGFLAQLGVVHYGLKATETGGAHILDKLPISEEAKGKIASGVSHTTGLAMTPFSHIYGVATGLFAQKIAERQKENIPITKEEGQKITDEVKTEVKTEIAKEKVLHPETMNPQEQVLKDSVAKATEEFKVNNPVPVEKQTQTVSTEKTRNEAINKPVESSGKETPSKSVSIDMIAKNLALKDQENFKEDTSHNVMSKTEQATKAWSFVHDNSEHADNIIFKGEHPPAGYDKQAIFTAALQKALEDYHSGKATIDDVLKYQKADELFGTRTGQTLGLRSKRYAEDHPSEWLAKAQENLGKSDIIYAKEKSGKTRSKVDAETKKMSDTVSKTAKKSLDYQSIIDSILC